MFEKQLEEGKRIFGIFRDREFFVLAWFVRGILNKQIWGINERKRGQRTETLHVWGESKHFCPCMISLRNSKETCLSNCLVEEKINWGLQRSWTFLCLTCYVTRARSLVHLTHVHDCSCSLYVSLLDTIHLTSELITCFARACSCSAEYI
jgi:hypothetical protein